MVFDPRTQGVLQQLAGNEFAQSLARALSTPAGDDCVVLAVKLPREHADFLRSRALELDELASMRAPHRLSEVQPEDLLKYLVAYYADQAQW